LFMSGLADEGAPTFEHAVEMFAADSALHADPLLATRAAIALCWLERSADARAPMAKALEAARARGAVSLLPYSLFIAAWAARRTGAWQDAIVHATEGVALARELGQAATMAQCLQELSTLTAAHGADADCRAQIAEGTAAARGVGADYITEILRAQLGLLELGRGENERALGDLRLSAQRLEQLGLRLHELVPGPDLVEALTRLGRLDEAREALSLVRPGANPRTAEALIERCRGLVADDAQFEAHFIRSLALHPDN
jgi:tetratricopeptide (TPR) repeat protein